MTRTIRRLLRDEELLKFKVNELSEILLVDLVWSNTAVSSQLDGQVSRSGTMP